MQRIVVASDGGCRNNPGDGSFAFVIDFPDGRKVTGGGFRKDSTVNLLEYEGLAAAAEYLADLGLEPSEIEFKSDSQLIVNHLNGAWTVRQESLLPIFGRALRAIAKLQHGGHKVTLKWIRREHNKEADALCGQIQDAHGVVALSWKEKIRAKGAMQTSSKDV